MRACSRCRWLLSPCLALVALGAWLAVTFTPRSLARWFAALPDTMAAATGLDTMTTEPLFEAYQLPAEDLAALMPLLALATRSCRSSRADMASLYFAALTTTEEVLVLALTGSAGEVP